MFLTSVRLQFLILAACFQSTALAGHDVTGNTGYLYVLSIGTLVNHDTTRNKLLTKYMSVYDTSFKTEEVTMKNYLLIVFNCYVDLKEMKDRKKE